MTALRYLAAALLLVGASVRAESSSTYAGRLSLPASPAAIPPPHINPTPVLQLRESAPPERLGRQGVVQIVGSLVLLAVLVGGGFYLLRPGIPAFPTSGPLESKLVVRETLKLGGRQYLLVLEYEGRRMLLGVSPGRIDRLGPLEPGASLPLGAPPDGTVREFPIR